MFNLKEIIAQIDSLSPISNVGAKIMEVTHDPNSSLSEIVELIRYDASMTANLLKICNSSYFGLRQKVVSLQQAVAYLGVDKVACLAMVGSSSGNLQKAQSGYDLNDGELWRNSISSALIAQDLAVKRRLQNTPLIFTSALLKDIGKVVLNNYISEAYKDILAAVQTRGLSFVEAEKEIIGIDHAELGGMVAARWNFSPEMIRIIRHHHSPDKGGKDDLALSIVYLADSICMMIGIGVGADGLSYRHHQQVMDRLKFSDIDLQKTIADFWERLKGVEELVALSQGDN